MREAPKTTRSTTTGTEIAVTALPSFSVQAAEVIRQFEAQHADWRDGYSIWMGWGPLYLRAADDGFVVESPDYGGNALMERTDDLTLALYTTVAITSVLAQAPSATPQEIGYNDAVLCANGWAEAQMLSFSRTPAEHGDSGWFIEPFGTQRTTAWPKEELESMPAWQLLQRRPAAIRPLGLPAGVAAILDGEFVRVVLREVDRAVLAEGPF